LQPVVVEVRRLVGCNAWEANRCRGGGNLAAIAEDEGATLPEPATVHGSAVEIARPEALAIVFVVEPVPNAVVSVSPSITPAAITPEVSGLLSDRKALVHVGLG
jgi:hypothetical protein